MQPPALSVTLFIGIVYSCVRREWPSGGGGGGGGGFPCESDLIECIVLKCDIGTL